MNKDQKIYSIDQVVDSMNKKEKKKKKILIFNPQSSILPLTHFLKTTVKKWKYPDYQTRLLKFYNSQLSYWEALQWFDIRLLFNVRS